MSVHAPKCPVYVAGVGCTPFYGYGDPVMGEFTYQEIFAWAFQQALDNAGLTCKDVDRLVIGNISGYFSCGKNLDMTFHLADWAGTEGKHASRHLEVCATAYFTLEEAVEAVASGMYDVAACVCVEFPDQIVDPVKPAYHIHPLSDYDEVYKIPYFRGYHDDGAYGRFDGCGFQNGMDEWGNFYMQEYGLTEKELRKVFNTSAINCRYNGMRNPNARFKESFEDIAKQYGFETAEDYLNSPYNPHLSFWTTAQTSYRYSNAASCAIFCSEEVARRINKQPIRVLGTAAGVYDYHHVHEGRRNTESVLKRVYEITGVKPEEIELFQTTDLYCEEILCTAEAAGYLPKGEGWKYILDGRTRFDGDKPINTNGGATTCGHANSASGPAWLAELVWQMRGEAGARQVKKLPKTTLLRGEGGGGQGTWACILRAEDLKK